MTRYVFRRLGGAIIILWVIITVTFALMHAIPGDLLQLRRNYHLR